MGGIVSRIILLPHNLFLSCPIILQFCTEHDSDAALLGAKFQNDSTPDTEVKDERDFAIFYHAIFVCFITKSFLTYSFFPPLPALSTISRPLSSSMCSFTPETANVGSSYNRMRGPGIGCWFSDRSNCSHWSLTLTLTLTSENISLYTTLLLLLVLIQLYSPRCWHLDSNYCRTRCRQSQLMFVLSRRCYCIRVCWGRSSRIFHLSRWLGQLSTVLTKDESPHTGYTFTPWVVSFTPPSIEHQVGGTSILRLIRTTMGSHKKDSRNPDRTAWQV